MYFWTINSKNGGIYTIKARTFKEACDKIGINSMNSRVIKVVSA